MADFSFFFYSTIAILYIYCLSISFRSVIFNYINQLDLSHLRVLSIFISLVYLAISGIVITIIPFYLRYIFSILLLILPFVSFLLLKKKTSKHDKFFSYSIILLLFIISIFSLKINLPENLPDGAYVNKHHDIHVKIQYMLGDLPADNAIPFVAGEYFAHDTSFVDNSPILPGQVVSNRPILISLAYLPLRLAILGNPPSTFEHIPKYNYVNTIWPDFRVFTNNDKAYSIFVGVISFFNFSLLFSLLLFLSSTFIKKQQKDGLKFNIFVALIFVTTPYFIQEVIFAWPKALAGSLILYATYIYYKYRSVYSGFFIGLAFLSHPYAMIYMAVLYGYQKIRNLHLKIKDNFQLEKILCIYFLTILPWLIWTRFIIKIEPDLTTQNLRGARSAFAFIWVRVSNYIHAIFPSYLTNRDLHVVDIFNISRSSLISSIGIVLFIYAFYCFIRNEKSILLDNFTQKFKEVVILAFVLSILIVSIYSWPVNPLPHGWQILIGIILIFIMSYLYNQSLHFYKIIYAQILLNIFILFFYFKKFL